MLLLRNAIPVLALTLLLPGGIAQQPGRAPDVPYVPTPQEVVDAMLKLGNVTKNDVLYDLGSGDGRIAISAGKLGAHAVGVDINPERIAEANKNAKAAGVTNRVRFIEGDLFQVPIKEATVVTLYLLPSINLKLKPRLLAELKPGTRVVSHSFDMGDWKPEKTEEVNGRYIYYWTIPQHSSSR